MKPPTILFYAVPYGYGPIGTLITVQRVLPKNYQCILLASGSSLELAKVSGGFHKIIPWNNNFDEIERYADLFLSSSFLINVMSPRIAAFAQSLKLPVIVIDNLFWMRSSLPRVFTEVTLYLIQNFVNVTQQVQKYSLGRSGRIVGAIIDRRYQHRQNFKKNQLLVHIGGLDSPLIAPSSKQDYILAIVEPIQQVLKKHNFERVLFTGSKSALDQFKAKLNIPRCEFDCLPFDQFIFELANSTLMLTSPGLRATMHAFHYKTPVIFLPPENLSQFIGLKYLRFAGAAPLSFHWIDNDPSCDFDDVVIDEERATKLIQSYINGFAQNKNPYKHLSRFLEEALKADDYQNMQLAQQGFIQTLGDNGAAECVQLIDEEILHMN